MFADNTLKEADTRLPGRAAHLPDTMLLCTLFIVLTLLATVLYVRTLSCPFLWDEYGLILDNAAQGTFQWEKLPSLFLQRYFHIPGRAPLQVDLPYYRPFTVLFHGVTYNLFGPIPFFFHLESLFLHIANAFLVFLLLSYLIPPNNASGTPVGVALASTLLFLVHPRNVETICIIANQTGLLCTFFSLLSLCFWASILTGDRCHRRLYFLSLLTLLLAMLSKETAYFLPLLHALLFLLSAPDKGKQRLWLLAGYFLAIGIPFTIRQFVLPGPSMGETLLRGFSAKGALLSHLGSVTALLFHQLDQWFFPRDIQLFQYPFFAGERSVREILVPVLACSAILWMLRSNRKILALGLGWFLIAYLPSSNLIPMGMLRGGGLRTGAHHLYLAQPGLALLVVAALFSRRRSRSGQRSPVRFPFFPWLFAGLLILCLGSQTYRFSGFFQNADAFYQGVLDRNPSYPGAWLNYGYHKLYRDREPDRAERILLDGLEALNEQGNPKGLSMLNWNLLHLYRENGRQEEADTLFQCLQEEWSEDPVGNIYLWRYLRKQAAR